MSDPPVAGPPRRSRPALNYFLSALLTVVFLYLAFRGTDAQSLLEAMGRANYLWLGVSLLVLMLSHVLRAWRWRYLLDPMKPGIGLRNLFSGVMVGYMMNNVLPRAGELVRPYVIGKLESISKSAAFGTIVVERIMDTISFLLLVAAMPLLYSGPLAESFPWLTRGGVILTCIMVPAIGLLIALMVRRDWTDRILGFFTRLLPERFARRVQGLVHSFLDGFLFVKNPGNFLVIFVLSALIWVLYAVMTYAGFLAFGLEDTLGFRGAIVTLAISSIGVAIPTPGSTGTYHAFASQTLMRLYTVDQATALSFATLTHATGFVGATVIGLYFFLKDKVSFAEAMQKRREPSA